jgi:two-component system NarL family sensor kinase
MAPDNDPVDASVGPDVRAVVLDHAWRGAQLQVALRWVLVGFTAVTILAFPPAHHSVLCAAVAAGYALWAVAVTVWSRRARASAVRLVWLALFVDVAVLTALTLLTGVAAPQSWTSDVLATGMLLVPVLAATQLRPRVCAAVVAPTVLAYLVAAVATRDANGEPWASVLLRTVTVAGVAAGCVGLSRIQRSRVRTIGGLVRGRSDLLAELSGLEQRERRTLSEQLHDGALQYVLAARQDLDDARDRGDRAAFARLEEALAESSRLLRSAVAELHPAVLARAGLPAAVRDLAASAAARGGLTARVDTDGWPDTLRTTADGLLHRTARELLGNVVKHADATTVTVTLACADGRARLVVADDGVGLPDRALENVLGAGHIGLASHAARVDAAGGRLVAARGPDGGTTVTVELPCRPEPPRNGGPTPSLASEDAGARARTAGASGQNVQ